MALNEGKGSSAVAGNEHNIELSSIRWKFLHRVRLVSSDTFWRSTLYPRNRIFENRRDPYRVHVKDGRMVDRAIMMFQSQFLKQIYVFITLFSLARVFGCSGR